MNDSEAREMARGLVRGSIIEDAASQFIAQVLKEAYDSRIKPLRDRIEELEAKLATAWDTQTVKILIETAYKEGWADGGDNVPLESGWKKSRTNATLAELTGGKNE